MNGTAETLISTRDTRQAIDRHVGRRLRAARLARGMSQQSLGAAVDISFQQLQKYESGKNRVSASVLYDFSRLLDVPFAYFFEDLPEPGAGRVFSRAQIRFLELYEAAPLRFRRLLLALLRWNAGELR